MGAFGSNGFSGGYGSSNRQRSLGINPQQPAGDYSAYAQQQQAPQQQNSGVPPGRRQAPYAAYAQQPSFQSPGQAQPIQPQSQGTPYNPSVQSSSPAVRSVSPSPAQPADGFSQYFSGLYPSQSERDKKQNQAYASQQWNNWTPAQRQGALRRLSYKSPGAAGGATAWSEVQRDGGNFIAQPDGSLVDRKTLVDFYKSNSNPYYGVPTWNGPAKDLSSSDQFARYFLQHGQRPPSWLVDAGSMLAAHPEYYYNAQRVAPVQQENT